MKRILFILAVLMHMSSGYSQLEVKSFELEEGGGDGSQYSKKDANGVACALIKVDIADPEATFDGDIVGAPEFRNGSFWIYMTPEATWLNVITKQYVPLRYEFPIPLKGLATFIMQIIKPISEIPTGQVNIRSNVKNVDIYIDEVKYSNVAPYVFKGTEGGHKIVLKSPGYMDAERQVDVVLGKTISVVINMDAAGSLKVNGVTYGSTNVDACNFQMGSNRFYYESPEHNVALRPFTIGKRLVPVALWNEVMGTKHERNNGPNGEVVNITYDDCQDFISLLNQGQNRHFRLPTEAEWEYARTHASELGIEDIGNTMEWCSDWFAHYSGVEETSPKGPSKGYVKVVRGGSLYGEDSWYEAPTYRWHQKPDEPSEKISLRLVEDK